MLQHVGDLRLHAQEHASRIDLIVLVELLNWQQMQRLTAGDQTIHSQFGFCSTVSKDGIFIGAARGPEMRNAMLVCTFIFFLPIWYVFQFMGNPCCKLTERGHLFRLNELLLRFFQHTHRGLEFIVRLLQFLRLEELRFFTGILIFNKCF